MKLFLNQALSSIKTVGSISPSSKYLVHNCLKSLAFKEHQLIFEFGAGNGCFTEEILKRIPLSSTLISFEVNNFFFNHCKEKYKSHPNFRVVNLSAFDFDQIAKEYPNKKIDYIISSLPFSLFKGNDVENLIDKVCANLTPDGIFVQYQYSLGKYRFLKKKFQKIKLDFIFRNIPPSFIYNCYIKH